MRVCRLPSLSPSANFPILPPGPKLKDRKREEVPGADRLRPPRPTGPRAPPGCIPPAPPVRTWSPRPAPPQPLPSTRVAAGAGVLNSVSRAQSARPRAPYWPRWLPITRHSRPGPAQALWSCCAALGLGSQGQTFRGSGGPPARVHHFPRTSVRHCWLLVSGSWAGEASAQFLWS